MNDSIQYCSFTVGDLYFGIEVKNVQEVIRYQEMTRVPLATGEIGGLINLRGQIVTAIDMRQRLKLSPWPADRRPMNVVIRTEDGPISLLVDEIGDVLDLAADTFESPPTTLAGPVRELTGGVHKLKGGLLLLLNTEKTIAATPAADAA